MRSGKYQGKVRGLSKVEIGYIRPQSETPFSKVSLTPKEHRIKQSEKVGTAFANLKQAQSIYALVAQPEVLGFLEDALRLFAGAIYVVSHGNVF